MPEGEDFLQKTNKSLSELLERLPERSLMLLDFEENGTKSEIETKKKLKGNVAFHLLWLGQWGCSTELLWNRLCIVAFKEKDNRGGIFLTRKENPQTLRASLPEGALQGKLPYVGVLLIEDSLTYCASEGNGVACDIQQPLDQESSALANDLLEYVRTFGDPQNIRVPDLSDLDNPYLTKAKG